MHISKIIIPIGVFLLCISHLSIALPITQAPITPEKTEQTPKKKPNFIQKIILKRITKKIDHDVEGASSLAQGSLWLGIISFPSVLIGAGLLTALIAIIMGIIALKRDKENRKSRNFAITGIVLGATLILAAAVLVSVYIHLAIQSGFI